MKNANGTGSITKLKDRRRKPWKVTVTTGFRFDTSRERMVQERKVVGCYRTKAEAEEALADFRRSPYDLDVRKLTFAEVYQMWSKVHYEKISPSLVRTYKSAYSHALPLHNLKFINIRPHHIEKAMADADVGSATKNGIKRLCGQLYKYGLKNEICSVNYATMCDGVAQDAPVIIRKVFTAEEEAVLWDNLDCPFVDMVLVGLYSGWRPQELAILRAEDVDLDNRVMYGGLKTKAGKSRAVPIHSAVLPLIKARLEKGGAMLFCDEKGGRMTYGKYQTRFNAICRRFEFKHTPHDTRHTFVTKAKEAGINEHILKLIVGHAIEDITEKVYTHRKIEELRAEMDKIPDLYSSARVAHNSP